LLTISLLKADIGKMPAGTFPGEAIEVVLRLNPTEQGHVRLIAAVLVEGMPQRKGLVINATVEGLQLQWQVQQWDPAKPLPRTKAAAAAGSLQPLERSIGQLAGASNGAHEGAYEGVGKAEGHAKRSSGMYRSSIVGAGVSGEMLLGGSGGGRAKSAAAVLGGLGRRASSACSGGENYEELLGAQPDEWIGGLTNNQPQQEQQQLQQGGAEEQQGQVMQKQGEGGGKLLCVDFGWVGLSQDAGAVVLLKNLTSMPTSVAAWVDVDEPLAAESCAGGSGTYIANREPLRDEPAATTEFTTCKHPSLAVAASKKEVFSSSMGGATAMGRGSSSRVSGGSLAAAAAGPFRAAQGNRMMLERRRQADAHRVLQERGSSSHQCHQQCHQGVVVVVQQSGNLLEPWSVMGIKLVAHNDMPGDYIRMLNVKVGVSAGKTCRG
jgi:hypothetical protein